MGMMITEEIIAEDEKRWNDRNIVAELGYCGKNIRHRKNITNDDIRFYAYIMRKAHAMLKEKKSEAKWIYGENKTGVDGWHCSECGFFEPWFYEFTDDIDFIRFYGFCPSCGRKMTSYTGKSVHEGRLTE